MNKVITGTISAAVIMVVVYISLMLVLSFIWAAAQTFILFENHFYVHLWHPLERAGILIGSITGLGTFIWNLRKK